MTHKTFSLISGIVFAIVAVVHLFRITEGWTVTVGIVFVPMWVSWFGLVISATLAYYGLRFGYSERTITAVTVH